MLGGSEIPRKPHHCICREKVVRIQERAASVPRSASCRGRFGRPRAAVSVRHGTGFGGNDWASPRCQPPQCCKLSSCHSTTTQFMLMGWSCIIQTNCVVGAIYNSCSCTTTIAKQLGRTGCVKVIRGTNAHSALSRFVSHETARTYSE